MSESDLRKLLATDDRDPGCDAAFAVFDEYCDAVRRGDAASEVEARFADFLTHVEHCVTCHEDLDTLLAFLRDEDERPR